MTTTLKEVLELTGLATAEELIDMAKVGTSLMGAIDTYIKPPSLIEGWSPADDPAEIVGDLYNLFEESIDCHKADLTRLRTAETALARCEADRTERVQQCDRMAADWADFCEAMGVTWDTQEAVAAELKARFEPLIDAANKVLTAEGEFRATMPADWQGDPLTDAVTKLRTALPEKGAAE